MLYFSPARPECGLTLYIKAGGGIFFLWYKCKKKTVSAHPEKKKNLKEVP